MYIYHKIIGYSKGTYHGLKHFISIFVDAYRHEKKSNSHNLNSLKNLEIEFLPAALEISRTPVSIARRALCWSISSLLVIAIAWSIIFKMDEIAIAPAKILPQQEVKKIQPLETSIVESIHVKEGQTVTRGQALLQLKVIGANENMAKLQIDYNRALGDSVRLMACLQDRPLEYFQKHSLALTTEQQSEQRLRLVQQIEQFTAKIISLKDEIASKRSEIKSLEADLQRLQALRDPIIERAGKLKMAHDQGYGNAIAVLKSQEEAIENQGQTEINKQKTQQSRSALAALQSNLMLAQKSFYSDISEKKAEAEGRLNVATHELQAAKAFIGVSGSL